MAYFSGSESGSFLHSSPSDSREKEQHFSILIASLPVDEAKQAVGSSGSSSTEESRDGSESGSFLHSSPSDSRENEEHFSILIPSLPVDETTKAVGSSGSSSTEESRDGSQSESFLHCSLSDSREKEEHFSIPILSLPVDEAKKAVGSSGSSTTEESRDITNEREALRRFSLAAGLAALPVMPVLNLLGKESATNTVSYARVFTYVYIGLFVTCVLLGFAMFAFSEMEEFPTDTIRSSKSKKFRWVSFSLYVFTFVVGFSAIVMLL
uniref:Transmembrane protein n=1 Tax=Nelumbo nucifera TaxID=4432 RepID=A0A822Z749_NELNU|nr:TPA_asm: hypothetical protein HUJ06_013598 [Nelumbo nucifera]